MYYYIMMFVIF